MLKRVNSMVEVVVRNTARQYPMTREWRKNTDERRARQRDDYLEVDSSHRMNSKRWMILRYAKYSSRSMLSQLHLASRSSLYFHSPHRFVPPQTVVYDSSALL